MDGPFGFVFTIFLCGPFLKFIVNGPIGNIHSIINHISSTFCLNITSINGWFFVGKYIIGCFSKSSSPHHQKKKMWVNYFSKSVWRVILKNSYGVRFYRFI